MSFNVAKNPREEELNSPLVENHCFSPGVPAQALVWAALRGWAHILHPIPRPVSHPQSRSSLLFPPPPSMETGQRLSRAILYLPGTVGEELR